MSDPLYAERTDQEGGIGCMLVILIILVVFAPFCIPRIITDKTDSVVVKVEGDNRTKEIWIVPYKYKDNPSESPTVGQIHSYTWSALPRAQYKAERINPMIKVGDVVKTNFGVKRNGEYVKDFSMRIKRINGERIGAAYRKWQRQQKQQATQQFLQNLTPAVNDTIADTTSAGRDTAEYAANRMPRAVQNYRPYNAGVMCNAVMARRGCRGC